MTGEWVWGRYVRERYREGSITTTRSGGGNTIMAMVGRGRIGIAMAAMAERRRAVLGAFGGSSGRTRGSPEEVAETVLLTSVEQRQL